MAQPTFNYRLPYTSQRQPVLAKNIVATSQPLAAQAGLDVLRRGGNAVDAAVATAMALSVVEPSGNGLGADNFALIWTGGGVHGLNSSGLSPARMTLDKYSGQDSVSTRGYDGVTVPGAPAGWVAAAKAYGTMPLKELARDAIMYAREGHLLSPGVARSYFGVLRRYREGVHKGFFEHFSQNGEIPGPGDLVRLPDHADSLEAIAETEADAFYRGEIAQKIEAHAKEFGGAIRASDMAKHEAEWVRPMTMDYRGWRLHEIPPNGQGIAALMALGICKHFDLDSIEADDPKKLHLTIEAMKLAFRDVNEYVADPAYMPFDPRELIAEDYLASRAKLIDPSRAQDFDHGKPKIGGTVLLATADAEGNMVSWIQSNYTGFGSGVVPTGTGVSLQNRGACFVLDEGHPNQLGPNKKPYHTIIPAFVTKPTPTGEEPVMTFGVMGGFMQPQGHLQVMLRMRDDEQNPQAAIDAPRWQIYEGLDVSIEPGFDDSVYGALESMGHNVRKTRSRSATFGRGQAIYRLEDGYVAGSDMRADGQAVGF